jgi:hypothetical protein
VNKDENRPGLGEVIYSVDDDKETREKKRKQKEVTEADEESFPASDPPAVSGSTADPECGSGVTSEGSQPER